MAWRLTTINSGSLQLWIASLWLWLSNLRPSITINSDGLWIIILIYQFRVCLQCWGSSSSSPGTHYVPYRRCDNNLQSATQNRTSGFWRPTSAYCEYLNISDYYYLIVSWLLLVIIYKVFGIFIRTSIDHEFDVLNTCLRWPPYSCFGRKLQNFWGHKEVICGLWPPQFVVAGGHNIWKVTGLTKTKR